MSTERWMLAVVSVVLDLVLSSKFILSSQAAPSPLSTTASVGFFSHSNFPSPFQPFPSPSYFFLKLKNAGLSRAQPRFRFP